MAIRHLPIQYAHARDLTMAAASRAFGPEPGCAQHNIDILWMDQRIGLGLTLGYGLQVGPVPGNNVLGGNSLSQPPPPMGSGTAVGVVSGVFTVSQLMQPCDSKLLKIADKEMVNV